MNKALPFERKKYTLSEVKPWVNTKKLKSVSKVLTGKQMRRKLNTEDELMLK